MLYEMTRIDAWRALLAKHQPCEDDQRAGHTYRFTGVGDQIRMTWQDRAKAILESRLRRIA